MARTFMIAAACVAVVMVSPAAFAQGKFGDRDIYPFCFGFGSAASVAVVRASGDRAGSICETGAQTARSSPTREIGSRLR